VIDVVGESYRDAARVCCAERAADDLEEVRRQVQVVDGDVERPLCCAEERGQYVRGLRGRLAAVDQRADFDRLYSRFAAW
jgi:hypothetical protein